MQDPRGVLDTLRELDTLSTAELSTRPTHRTVVLVDPGFFDRTYVINPHMAGEVDRERARTQWEQLRAVYERHAPDVRVLDPATVRELIDGTAVLPPTDQPDMVFVANHAVPTAAGDELVPARMSTPERADEPAYFGAWAHQQGYGVRSAPTARFEGAGDAIWHPGRRLLWGGHGVRTDRAAYGELATRLDTPVVPLELADERYFHLDLCLLPLSETTALVQPEAFTDASQARIEAVFETVLEAPVGETLDAFAVNGEVLDGTVVTGTGVPETTALLEANGYDVVSVETSEFLKAGGSVGCLTLRLGRPDRDR